MADAGRRPEILTPAATAAPTGTMREPEPAAVREMFGRLAPAYDRFNLFASLGLDAWWRARTVRRLRPGDRVLDLGCGTGDLALAAARRVGTAGSVLGADFSADMIALARRKGDGVPGLAFVEASADRLPVADGSCDAVVSAFVLRSLARVRRDAAREVARVLRPGGMACLLELTRPRPAPLRAAHRLYLTRVLPVIGRLVAGARWPKDYLAVTILDFPEPETYAGWFTSEGLTCERVERLTGGIASLLVLRKA